MQPQMRQKMTQTHVQKNAVKNRPVGVKQRSWQQQGEKEKVKWRINNASILPALLHSAVVLLALPSV